MSGSVHRVYLIPGMFGFARLAGFEYFGHIERALEQRFRDAGVPVVLKGIPSLPTASLRRRAATVARAVATDTDPAADDPIHLIGHSTGGLDARLLATPGARLRVAPETLAWTGRLRTVITINAPHYGTPLAKFFSTVSGTRLLYALSLVSVATLSLGSPPLSLLTNVAAALGSMKVGSSFELKTLERLTDAITRRLSSEERETFHNFMDGIRYDQGGILQLMPETMDVFNAAVADAPGVRYGSVVSSAPPPATIKAFRAVRSPYAALTAAIYSTLHSFASGSERRYFYAEADEATRTALRAGIGHGVTARDCDGVVPTLSMVWGELVWAGAGDHLDVVGHFADDASPAVHADWMTSGSGFGRRRFDAMIDALAGRLLAV